MSTSSATDIPRCATLIQRKLQLRKSLAAKAKSGGKVASMVQKLQEHHEKEDGESAESANIQVVEIEEGGSEMSSIYDFVSSPPPPPPLPKPLDAEQTEMEESAPRPSAETPAADHKVLDLIVLSSSVSQEQNSDAASEAGSNILPLKEVHAKDMEKLRSEKNDLHAKLQAYEADFVANHGREVETHQDLEPVAQLYTRYLAVKKEVAQRNKEKLSTKSTKNSRSTNRRHTSQEAALSSPLDITIEAQPAQEKSTEEGDATGLERIGSREDSENSCDLQADSYIAVESRKKTTVVSSKPAGQAKPGKQGGGDSDADIVVAAVAAILDNDKRNKVDDPGHFVQIPEEEDDDSIASEPGRITTSSVAQPFDEISQGDEIMSTPERLNKANSRNKGSPAGVASLSADELPQRIGARPLLSTDGDIPEAPPLSFRSFSRTVPRECPWPACLADDGSILSAQSTCSSGSANDFDNDTYCTPAMERIRQTAPSSRNIPRSNQPRSIGDILTCKPRDEDIGSIDSGGGPLEVCKPDVCKAPASGSKSNPYTSKPMPIGEANSFIASITEKKTVQRENAYTSKAMSIDEANSFIVDITGKKTIQKEEEQMTDITFPSIQEEETWSNMVDEMMKTLEEDVASAKKTTTSQNPDTSDNIASDQLQANASASKLAFAMEELDSLKAEFDGISKKLTISNDHLKELERRVEERDQTIATLQLERDLAQADVKYLNVKLKRLEDETEEANAITRRTMKKKDAQIALLQRTIEKLIEKLKQEPNAGNILPTVTSSKSNADSQSNPNTITPKPMATKFRSPSPLHPDDELDDDLQSNKGIDETSQNQLTELSLLSSPLKADQKSRAIDICRRNNKQISISNINNGEKLSSPMVEEALSFVRGLREGRGF